MPEKSENGRTHEPSLRETVSQLDDLKELLLVMLAAQAKVTEERDRRFEDKFKSQEAAVVAALSAQKDATLSAFMASEKAIVKAEDAQREYNARSNEFRGQLDDQAKLLMSRSEAGARFDATDLRIEELKKRYDSELASLREFRSETGGQRLQHSEDRTLYNWSVGLAITIGLAVISLTAAVIFALVKKPG